MLKVFFYIVFFLLVVFGVTFSYLNAAPVAVNYLIGERFISLSLLLICSFGFGLFLGFILLVASWLRFKNRIRKLKRGLRHSQKEIEQLHAAAQSRPTVENT
jgi:uncharacterized membrane protein YciS (DUF1049 family)